MVPRAVLMKNGPRSLNTVRPVNTAHPKTTVYSARPMSKFSKSAQSTIKRPYQIRTTLTNKNCSQKVNTAKGKIYTARPNLAFINAMRANQVNVVKASACWVWRPTILNRSSTKEDQGYVYRGCSRHMTGNMSYLSDFKEFDGGYVTFGGGAKGEKITGKGTFKTGKLDFEDVYFVKELQFNLFSVSQMCDKKNTVLFTNTGCFVLSPNFKLADESQVLLKVPRKNNMCSVDMKNIVPKESLTCLVTKATLDELMLWHRRLGKATQSLLFTWVFFLASKDETSGILKRFITEIENLVDKKKCIKKEFSVARTPKKNGVAERRNRTLIEAAKTMLADSKLPTTFWAEAVNTACYVHNRVDGKSDEGFFVGYSLNSKAFRVYNIRTRKVEESLHIRFLEDKPIIAGDRPKWLFDIDVLTKSMNYVPVIIGTNSNDLVDGLLFDFSLKNDSNDEPQPSSDAGKKDDEGVNKESGIDDQERPENSSQDVNTAGPSINTVSTNINTGSLNINIVSPTVTTAPLEATHVNFFGDETEINMSNITTTYLVPSTPNTRIHKDHSLDHVIGDMQSGEQTGRMTKTTNEQGFISAVYEGKTHKDLHTCLFACFLSQEKPKKVYMNKKDERGIVIRNKARLVAQGYTQEEGIDYDQVFDPVARIKAIRLFLAYASFKDFVVYQMDVKSAFLYGKIEEEVYVCQPLGFEDPEFPDRVYKVEKALYGLHQAPRACDILLVQLYVDDIIFVSTKKKLCTEFEKLMHKKFQMSSMGELTFFLGLQVTQKDDEIFISQDKYMDEILKKFGFSTMKTASTPMETSKPLMKDENEKDVDVHLYRSMIGSLMYLTSSRPDIIYLKGQPKLGIWYHKDPPFDLEAYTDSDYAGASLDRKSTIGGCQFLGSRLISWQCKKQTVVANSTTEAEYVAAASYHDEKEYENETHDERQELCQTNELPVCNMRRFKMIKYSFRLDEEYIVVKEDEYDDLEKTSNDACRAYQEIFRMMDEG
ncbi:putative ribonuclease H-like domain-containing protein [Tanacetum coccineum]